MVCSIISYVANAQVAELADAQDLKFCGTNIPCRFDPGLGHHVGVSVAYSDFFMQKISVCPATPPFPQKEKSFWEPCAI